jgi:hypothetical protein
MVPGSTYWDLCYGLDQGDFAKLSWGIKTMPRLAPNMVLLLKK